MAYWDGADGDLVRVLQGDVAWTLTEKLYSGTRPTSHQTRRSRIRLGKLSWDSTPAVVSTLTSVSTGML